MQPVYLGVKKLEELELKVAEGADTPQQKVEEEVAPKRSPRQIDGDHVPEFLSPSKSDLHGIKIDYET